MNKRYFRAAAVGLVAAGLMVACWEMAQATALTTSRDTPARTGQQVAVVAASNQIVYAGSMVAVNSSGYAVPAADTSGHSVLGRCDKTMDTRLLTLDNNNYVTVSRGIFRWANADSIARADIGKIVYVTDDQTVNKTGGGNNIIAGAVVDVDSSGVWVDTGKIGPIGAATPSSLAVSGAATVSGSLAVTGAQTNSGTLRVGGALTASAAATVGTTLAVTQGASLPGGITAAGTNTYAGAKQIFSGLPNITATTTQYQVYTVGVLILGTDYQMMCIAP
jgi:3D (Asp-Asp-Asp) domain-containing protein